MEPTGVVPVPGPPPAAQVPRAPVPDPTASNPWVCDLLKVTPLPGGFGLRLVGEVDMSSHEVLADALQTLVAGSGDVILDLDGLAFIDVGGVALLTRIARNLGPGRRMVVRHPPPFFRRLLALLWGHRHAVEVEGA